MSVCSGTPSGRRLRLCHHTSVSATPLVGGPSPSQQVLRGRTPSHSRTEASHQQGLPTLRPGSTHNYRKREKAPDLSGLTENWDFLRDLRCEGPILPASFLAGLTSRGAYRKLENTRFLLKSVVSGQSHDCVVPPHAPPPLTEAQTGRVTWRRQRALHGLSFSFHYRVNFQSSKREVFSL